MTEEKKEDLFKKYSKNELIRKLKKALERNVELAGNLVEAEKAIVMRCRMEGCRYGYEKYHKTLHDKCIWCGTERPKGKGHLIDTAHLRGLNDKKLNKLIIPKQNG